MVDVVASAFDDHLDDLALALKQQFRWIKRRYREKIDVNRNASKIELKVREAQNVGVLQDEFARDRSRVHTELVHLCRMTSLMHDQAQAVSSSGASAARAPPATGREKHAKI